MQLGLSQMFVSVLIILVTGHNEPLKACTVFYAASGDKVFGAANKSHQNLDTRMKVFSGDTLKYDRLYLGYGVPQGFQNAGGINEHGLWYDGASLPERSDIQNVHGKPTRPGELCEFVLESCRTVEDVRQVYSTYFTPHWQGHSMWGDAQGNSVIIEFGDDDVVFLETEDPFQVMTNFYLQNNVNDRWKHCYRFEVANTLLSDCEATYSSQDCRKVLQETKQNGIPPTVYSAVYDLTELTVTLYNFSNFQESVIIDIPALLGAGPHEYRMPEQFSNIWLESPINADVVSAETVHLNWYGDQGEYLVFLSLDADFSNPVIYSSSNISTGRLYLLALPLSFAGIPLLYRTRAHHKRKVLLLINIAIVSVAMYGCLNPLYSPYSPSEHEHTIAIDDLEPGQLYYWKVQFQVDNGIMNESLPNVFWTLE